MGRRLHEELKSVRPYELAEETHLSIVRTAALLEHAFGQVLKPYGLTTVQYNVLRILRGAGEGGLCVYELAERMLRPVPDVPRLLDRMRQMKLIVRRRADQDRRMVRAQITARGLALLEKLDEPIAKVHRERLAHMSAARLTALNAALADVREHGD